MGSPKEGQIIEWIMHTKEQMKEVGIVWATLTYWLHVIHMHQHIEVVNLAMLFVCWLTYHSHMVLLCNKGRIQWQAKCSFNHIRSKKTVVGTGCTPMGFQAFDVLVQSNITFGIDKKIHPPKYYNVTTTTFMAFFNKKTNILWNLCRMIVKFEWSTLNCSITPLQVGVSSWIFHFIFRHWLFICLLSSNHWKKKKKKQGFKQAALQCLVKIRQCLVLSS